MRHGVTGDLSPRKPPNEKILQLADCSQRIVSSQNGRSLLGCLFWRPQVSSFFEAMTMLSGLPVDRRPGGFSDVARTSPTCPALVAVPKSFRHHKLPAPRSVASIQNRGRPRMGWNYIRIDSSGNHGAVRFNWPWLLQGEKKTRLQHKILEEVGSMKYVPQFGQAYI